MTTADLIKLVRLCIGELAASRWEDDEIIAYLNEAQEMLVVQELPDAALLPFTRRLTIDFPAGANYITLPVDFVRERYVLYGNTVARRLSIQDYGELEFNTFFDVSAQNPFYIIADGRIYFYAGNEAQTPETIELYYVQRPMYIRSVAQQSNTLITVPSHSFSTDDIGSQIVIEEAVETSGQVNGVVQTIQSIVDANTISVGTITAQATGGRLIHLSKGQITASVSPLLSEIYQPLLVLWATLRCHEQQWEWDERNRLMRHFKASLEIIKSRYRSALPYDGRLSDAKQRQFEQE